VLHYLPSARSMTMLDLTNLHLFVSLDAPPFAGILAFLREMRDRPDYEALPSSSATLSAAQVHRLVPDGANLHVVLVDVPASLDALVSDWLQGTPVPGWYQGENARALHMPEVPL
jgi:hypothetical protein